MAEKRCFKCGEVKSLSEYYVHKRMADGHLNKCKACTKKDVKTNYRDNIEYYTEYEKQRNSLDQRKADAALKQRKHREENPEKYKARTAVSNAIRDGRLIRGKCFHCGSEERIQGHHHDYSKPLDVLWVCFKCHRQKEHDQFDYLD